VRAPARNLTLLVLFCGVIAPQLEIRPFTSRQRAHIEEQRVRDISAAFAGLEKALRNTARPTWGPSRPDRLAYLQAKFDRRVSDPASRHAAAELIEEWRRRSMDAGQTPIQTPHRRRTGCELMMALSTRRYDQHVAKARVLNGDDQDRRRLSLPFVGRPPRFVSSPSRPRPQASSFSNGL
jgi:hypothetical protein